jgi:hypothetical protein
VAVNEAERKLIIADNPSRGWHILDLDDGAVIQRGTPYWSAGFRPLFGWIGSGKVVHVDSGSYDSYLTVMEESTGRPLADAYFPETDQIERFVMTADRSRLYVGGYHLVAEVEIPGDL